MILIEFCPRQQVHLWAGWDIIDAASFVVAHSTGQRILHVLFVIVLHCINCTHCTDVYVNSRLLGSNLRFTPSLIRSHFAMKNIPSMKFLVITGIQKQQIHSLLKFLVITNITIIIISPFNANYNNNTNIITINSTTSLTTHFSSSLPSSLSPSW